MVNRSSALESNYSIGTTTNRKTLIEFKEINDLQLIQVAIWPDSINKVGLFISRSCE